jgi:cyclic lactone autoinducer peptide
MKKKLERVILEQIEKMSRKNAQSSNEAYPGWSECPSFLHQPKRPRK